MHTHVLTIHTPIDVCMHIQHMQAYILHPDMKVIKLRASDLFEKKKQQEIYTIDEESFGYSYCLKAI